MSQYGCGREEYHYRGQFGREKYADPPYGSPPYRPSGGQEAWEGPGQPPWEAEQPNRGYAAGLDPYGPPGGGQGYGGGGYGYSTGGYGTGAYGSAGSQQGYGGWGFSNEASGSAGQSGVPGGWGQAGYFEAFGGQSGASGGELGGGSASGDYPASHAQPGHEGFGGGQYGQPGCYDPREEGSRQGWGAGGCQGLSVQGYGSTGYGGGGREADTMWGMDTSAPISESTREKKM